MLSLSIRFETKIETKQTKKNGKDEDNEVHANTNTWYVLDQHQPTKFHRNWTYCPRAMTSMKKKYRCLMSIAYRATECKCSNDFNCLPSASSDKYLHMISCDKHKHNFSLCKLQKYLFRTFLKSCSNNFVRACVRSVAVKPLNWSKWIHLRFLPFWL